MGVIDTAFLGHLGTCELAASSVASVAMRVPGMLLWGSTQALCTLCAQAMGSGNKPLVGLWLQTGMVIFTVFSLVVALLWIFTVGPLLRLFAIDDDVVTMGVRYARWSTLWIWPNAMYQCLRWYFQAQNNVQPAMIINFVFIGVNAALNYVLIFGLGRWHGIGYIGSPVATAISIWLQLITYIIYMFAIRKYHIGTWPNWSLAEVRTWAAGLTASRSKCPVRHHSLPFTCVPAVCPPPQGAQGTSCQDVYEAGCPGRCHASLYTVGHRRDDPHVW